MSGRLRAAAVAVAFCWVVALLAAVLPVKAEGNSCGRAIGVALSDEDEDVTCVPQARRRLGFLVAWLVLTGGVSTAFVASCALAGRRTE